MKKNTAFLFFFLGMSTYLLGDFITYDFTSTKELSNILSKSRIDSKQSQTSSYLLSHTRASKVTNHIAVGFVEVSFASLQQKEKVRFPLSLIEWFNVRGYEVKQSMLTDQKRNVNTPQLIVFEGKDTMISVTITHLRSEAGPALVVGKGGTADVYIITYTEEVSRK